jgi:GH24 family phage-related lysozyme (muramidase)
MTICTDQWSFTAPFEGIVRHLYLDSVGKVTCGVGFMLPDEAACGRMVWTPNAQEAIADFRRLREEHGPYEKFAAAHYRPMVRAHLSEGFMREEFARRSAAFVKQLGSTFVASIPIPGQIALLDMAYNLGVAGVAKFHNLHTAIAAKDWAAAARECHRGGVSELRNQATAAQWLACA